MSDPRFPIDDPDGPLCGGDPLARALARLAPATAGLATPDFLFAAGRASEARRVAFWRRLCLGQTALGCAGAALVAGWAASPPERVPATADTALTPAVAELAPPPREVTPPDSPPVAPTGFAVKPGGDEPTLDERARWLRVRNDVLTAGLTMMPEAVPPPRPPAGSGGFPSPGRDVFAAPPRSSPPNPEDDR